MKRFWQWVPAVVWAMAIWRFSSAAFSSIRTADTLLPLLHKLLPFASPATLETTHHLIRKNGHVLEYFILSLLLLRAVGIMQNGWKFKPAIIALGIAAVYSGLDEFHQSFVPNRGASAWDSLLDTAAAALGLLSVWWWMDRRAGRQLMTAGAPEGDAPSRVPESSE